MGEIVLGVLIFLCIQFLRVATEVACFFTLLRVVQSFCPKNRLVGAFCMTSGRGAGVVSAGKRT